MTDHPLIPLVQLEQRAENITRLIATLHPLQRASLFHMIAAEMQRTYPDNLTLVVMFDRLKLEYENLLTRDESH